MSEVGFHLSCKCVRRFLLFRVHPSGGIPARRRGGLLELGT